MKLASEIIGTEIFSRQENSVIGKVKEIIIDPENGNLVGFQLFGEKIKKDKNIVSALEVRHFDSEVLLVDSSNKIEPKEELPRAYGIVSDKIWIKNCKVFNQNNDYLGRVDDFAFDLDVGKLTRIYVSKKGLGYIFQRHFAFSYEQIIEIGKNKIIVNTENRIKIPSPEIA